MPLDYQSLRVMAKSIGRPIADLLALSQPVDPFYAGVPFRTRQAEWFAKLWTEHGTHGGHLRRFHYRLVSSTTPVLLLDSKPYENTNDCWKLLVTASLSARYLDLIPFDALTDRRNAQPMIFAKNLQANPNQPRRVSCAHIFDDIDLDIPDMPSLPGLYVNGLNAEEVVSRSWWKFAVTPISIGRLLRQAA